MGNLIKRIFDLVAAVVGLLVMSPVCLIIWIAIKFEDHGPAIFSQERIGYKGKPFMLYKFRSMIMDAEEDGRPQLYSGGEDSRLTKVGRFIRDHHVDELPQLWNVIKGDMSFVGYRPERKFFIEQIMEQNPDYELLYKMRPGLFSMATLYNGYTDTMEKMLERLRMDLDYLHNHSLWLDIKIIFLTAISIISGKKF
ncbi:MAG: sugar transferase [Alistipes sp.]|nr:sugar transferase [Alistipes sp.]